MANDRRNSQIEQLDLNSDTKCIGNRKLRTIILCLLLQAFSIFAAPHLTRRHVSSFLQLCGLLFISICAFISMITICTVKNTTNKHILSGFGIIFGAILYFGGCGWYIFSHTQTINISSFALFGEAFLFGSTAIVLGIDILLPSLNILSHPHKRLFTNLLILCIVCIFVTPSAITLGSPGEVIASGYIIIFISTLIYIILILAKCCSYNQLHYYIYLPIIRITVAMLLMIGGVINCIGYYIFASDGVSLSYSDVIENAGSRRLIYYIGYIILIGGLCTIWSFNIITTLIYLNDKLNEINNNQSSDGSNNSNRYTITNPESVPEIQLETQYSEVEANVVGNQIPPPYNPDAMNEKEDVDNTVNEGAFTSV